MYRKLFSLSPYEILGVKKDSTDVEILGAAIKKFSSLPYIEEQHVGKKMEMVNHLFFVIGVR
jgi:hypothetical protein